MAEDVVIQGFSVIPVEDDQGNLVALDIQPTRTVRRVSETGSMLLRGRAVADGDPLTVPVGELPELLRKLAGWPVCYVMGKPSALMGTLTDWTHLQRYLDSQQLDEETFEE